ncbi:MAG TPA: hypothetical protein VKY90_04575 [Candidatus Dormibacteraeota bacterium]|nr:hypothetical protein [Candidatus Dormibacteraeota bacterium]
MAADLDLSRGRAWSLPLILGVVAAAGLATLVASAGGATAVLVGCPIAGAGLTYLSGLPLRIEERLAYGTVIGAAVMSTIDLLLALAAGLEAATVLAGLGLAVALSGAGWWHGRRLLGEELADAIGRWRRGEPWPLWLLLLIAWPFTLLVLAESYRLTDQGLIAGNPGVYADWAAHLTFAGAFAYGRDFPPQFPIDPGHPMTYPFLVDLLAAALVPLGTSLPSSLVLTSGLLGLALPAVLYLAGVRLIASRAGAALAVLVVSLSGGLGFIRFFQDLASSGLSVLQHLPRLYTQDPAFNLQWLNPVLAWMIPQRSTLLGFSLAPLVMAMLWAALRRERARGARAWTPFVFTGVVTGLTPLCHLHAYGTIVALSGFWAVLSRRREWIAFFVPALALGLGPTLWMLSGGAAGIRVQLWWMADTAGHHDGPIWFWVKNTGPLVPAMAVGTFWPGTALGEIRRYLAPIWLWFLVPNFLVFQPWDWDNTKFFAYWLLFGSLFVGALLARLFRQGAWARGLAVLLSVTMMLAGGLDLARTLEPSVSSSIFTDAGGVRAAAWVRTHTPAHAIFLVAPDHNQPIPTLAGRRVVVGYGGWLWTYGLDDWARRTADAERMLRGAPAASALAHRYGVDYVVIGPQELQRFGADPGYWARHGVQVYDHDGYRIYRVR